MGYTIENKKIVIWTAEVSEAWGYPFNDEVTDYTYFYKNRYSKDYFLKLPAANIDEVKIESVSKELSLRVGSFILKPKKSQHNKKIKLTRK